MNPGEYPDDLVTLAERLRTDRPAPSVALRRRLQEVLGGAGELDPPAPRRTTGLIAAFGTAGTLLLAAGAVITFL